MTNTSIVVFRKEKSTPGSGTAAHYRWCIRLQWNGTVSAWRHRWRIQGNQFFFSLSCRRCLQMYFLPWFEDIIYIGVTRIEAKHAMVCAYGKGYNFLQAPSVLVYHCISIRCMEMNNPLIIYRPYCIGRIQLRQRSCGGQELRELQPHVWSDSRQMRELSNSSWRHHFHYYWA